MEKTRSLIMPRRNVLLGCAAGLIAPATCVASGGRAPAPVDVDPTVGRKLDFDEPFHSLDQRIWHAGPKSGNGDPGYYGRSAFARIQGEEGFNPYEIVDDPRATDGKALQISAKHIGRRMNVPNYYGNDRPEFQWVSGNIQTALSDGTVMKGWRHGYFEARMQFAKHPLTIPAFWLLNAHCILNPQTSIEIDIVEQKGFEPNLYGAYLHEHGEPGRHNESSPVTTPTDMSEGYNRYGVLVEDDWCAPFFERKWLRHTITGQPLKWKIGRSGEMAKHKDVFWPLITFALVADYPYPDPLKPEDELTSMRVDYFRVYK